MRQEGDERIDLADVGDGQGVVDERAKALAQRGSLADVEGKVGVLLDPVEVRAEIAGVGRDHRVQRAGRLRQEPGLAPEEGEIDGRDARHDQQQAPEGRALLGQ